MGGKTYIFLLRLLFSLKQMIKVHVPFGLRLAWGLRLLLLLFSFFFLPRKQMVKVDLLPSLYSLSSSLPSSPSWLLLLLPRKQMVKVNLITNPFSRSFTLLLS